MIDMAMRMLRGCKCRYQHNSCTDMAHGFDFAFRLVSSLRVYGDYHCSCRGTEATFHFWGIFINIATHVTPLRDAFEIFDAAAIRHTRILLHALVLRDAFHADFERNTAGYCFFQAIYSP